MKSSPLVSIVIPIYGVEEFIEQAATSYLSQTYDNIEYIFVNDCTKDNSISILKAVLKKFPKRNIIIVNKDKNEGLPQARKTGMLYVHGEYVMHLDSDDWADKTMVEEMLQKAMATDADIVYADNYVEKEGVIIEKRLNREISSPYEYMKWAFYMQVSGTTWTKLYRKSVFHKLVFPVSNMHEDLVINLQAFCNSKFVVHINKAFYHYRINPNSLARNYNISSALDNITYMRDYILGNNINYLIKPFCGLVNGVKNRYSANLNSYDKNIEDELWKIYPKSDLYILSLEAVLGIRGRLRLLNIFLKRLLGI